MSDISQWSTSAGSNNAAPPDGMPEGQAPSTVNDSVREIMAAVARLFQDIQGGLVTAGSGNTYTLTTNTGNAALADQSLLVFRADRANTGAATLNVDTLGAKSIEIGGAALVSGDLVLDSLYVVAYNSNNDTYDLLNQLSAAALSTKLSLGSLALKNTINGDDWSGTDLAIVDGGTGSSSASAARTALAVAPLTLAGVDFTGLTVVEGNGLDAGDDFLVMDGTTAKRIPYSDGGAIVPAEVTVSTNKTFTSVEMNQIWSYNNASDVLWDLDTGVGKKGNWLVLIQVGAGQIDLSGGTATVNMVSSHTGTRVANSVIVGWNMGSDVWQFTGDSAVVA